MNKKSHCDIQADENYFQLSFNRPAIKKNDHKLNYFQAF